MDKKKYRLREARDTLIDQILHPLCASYPVPDLPVRAENPVVLYNNPTHVIISFNQPDVGYEVYDDSNNKVNLGAAVNDGELFIQTALLTKQDYTFNIIATKTVSGLSKQLLQTVTVKVGVDVGLTVLPKEAVIDFGRPGVILVKDTQSGAKYQAFDANDKPASGEVDSGDGGDLEIVTTDPLKEDTVFKIHVTNIKTGLSGVLTMQAAIKVNPDVGLIPNLKEPVINYKGKAVIRLDNTQKSADYQLLFKDIDDDTVNKAELFNSTIGKPVAGTGGVIELPDSPLQEDITVSVLATKKPSGIQKELLQTVVIPVRPDPDKKLTVVEAEIKAGQVATIKVNNTQRGILYQLQADKDKTNVGMPGYHHKNYGIGKARIGIEFAIDTFKDDSVYLPTGPLNVTTTFSVLAIKATTRQTAVVGTITVEVK